MGLSRMCWSAEVSLQSFLIGITAVVVGYQNGLSLPITLFCLTIVFMQLIEFFVWTFYTNPTVNFVTSIFAVLLLWLQPIASIFTLQNSYRFLAFLSYGSLSLLLFLIPDSTPLKEKYKMERAKNGHLEWKWLQPNLQTSLSLLVYFLFLFVPLILRQQFVLLGISFSTLALSLYSFYKDNTWGSMWCWMVNYIVVGICGYIVLVPKP